MNLLNLTALDWAQAADFFKRNPLETKMMKKKENSAFSFVKFKDRIIALGYKLGAGAFGTVKVGQDSTGENFAVKIEAGELTPADNDEQNILQLMEYSFGMVERLLDCSRIFYPDNPSLTMYDDKKKYKLLKLLEGNDLVFELYDRYSYEKLDKYVRINKLTEAQKLIIAIKCCQALQLLQKLRIIHADLKPENIKVKIDNDDISVRLMDFGFSMILPQKSTSLVDGIKGTLPYMAPEIYNTNQPKLSRKLFSFESDIYAIGIMFKSNLKLSNAIYEGMLKDNPHDRDTVEVTINKLLTELEQCHDLDAYAKAFANELKETLQPKTSKPQHTSIKPFMAQRNPIPTCDLSQLAQVKLKPVQVPMKGLPEKTEPKKAAQLKPVNKKTAQDAKPIEVALTPVQPLQVAPNKAVLRKRALPVPPIKASIDDFDTLKPSELKINRIEMLKQKLMHLPVQQPMYLPQSNAKKDCLTPQYEGKAQVKPVKGGQATPLVLVRPVM